MKKQVIELLKDTKAPTKKGALSLVTNIMEKGEITPEELAQLYLYFQPKSRKSKTRKDFLSNIIDKKSKRESIRYIYSNGEDIVATDGVILTIVPVEQQKDMAKPGYYHQTTYDYLGNIEHLVFPNYKLVFSNTKSTIKLNSYIMDMDSENNPVVVFDEYKYDNGKRIAVTKENFDKAKSYEMLSQLESISTYEYKGITPYSPIIFKFEDGTVIVVACYNID